QIIDIPLQKRYFPQTMLFPVWGLKPVFPANDVQAPILIDVGNGRRFIGPFVNQMFAKHWPVRRFLLGLTQNGVKDTNDKQGNDKNSRKSFRNVGYHLISNSFKNSSGRGAALGL